VRLNNARIVGGGKVFGFLGLFVGSVILAVTITCSACCEMTAARGMRIGMRKISAGMRAQAKIRTSSEFELVIVRRRMLVQVDLGG
jgi:hypothetical protein